MRLAHNIVLRVSVNPGEVPMNGTTQANPMSSDHAPVSSLPLTGFSGDRPLCLLNTLSMRSFRADAVRFDMKVFSERWPAMRSMRG